MTADAIAVRWPGVVVLGGGVTGLLTALELERRGFPVVVIEQAGLCAGQTGQCHGWLHRGAIYPDARSEDFDQLDRGANRWLQLAEKAGLASGAMPCHLSGRHDSTRALVESVWDRLDLTYAATEPRAPAHNWTLHGPEHAIVPIDVFRTIMADSSVVLRRARAIEFLPEPDQRSARSLVVRAGRRRITISARAFVVACGAGINGVLSTLPARSWRLTRRLSFMLVVRSAAVPDNAIAIPERDALGLFAVPRLRAGKRMFLVSNFMSYVPRNNALHARANWLAGIRIALAYHLPMVWNASDAEWGVYPAVKVEMAREFALGVASSGVLPTTLDNVSAGIPGKLVLAPLLADRLADRVVQGLHARGFDTPTGDSADTLPALLPEVHWGPEEWEVTPLIRRTTLFGEVPREEWDAHGRAGEL